MPDTPTPVEQARALFLEGRVAEAERLCADLLRTDPQNVGALRVLGAIARFTDKPEQAVQAMQFAMRIAPNDPAVAGEMCASLIVADRAHEAMPTLRELVKQQPKNAIVRYWLGQAYLKQFDGVKAAECFRTAYELDPQNDEILRLIGAALLAAGRGRDAEPWLRQHAQLHPDSPQALANLSVALQQQIRIDEAADLDRQALRIDPNNAAAISSLSKYYRAYANYDAALQIVRDGLARIGHHPALAAAMSFLCDKDELADEGIAVLEKALERSGRASTGAVGMSFGLGRLYERTGRYDEAWAQFEKANTRYANLYRTDLAELLTTELLNTFNAWTLSIMPKATIDTSRPVFIVGMTRSGTTLTEQILASHPRCFGAGELLTLNELGHELGRRLGGRWPTAINNITPELADEFAGRYLEHIHSLDPAATRVVDKLPHNFKMIGLMCVLFPQARIIHCIRNPLDVLVSNFATPLSPRHTWRPRLETLAHSYNEYRKIMEHFRREATLPILDVVYEDTITDIEKQARRIIAFVGLEWDDRCLQFHKHARAVNTASVDQVRKPIYQSSKQRWRRYEKHLGPLIDGLRTGGTNIDRPFDVEPF